ncbi:MAG: ABC transporter ATP-binding protein, partial [Tepidiformaceae bacterium]
MIASLRGVSYSYPGNGARALDDVDLDVKEGSFQLLAGPSAGGKSTLLRLFNGLVPQFHGGRLAGSLTVTGLAPSRTPARRMATIAGLVFQEPESQAVADTVEDEIAFGMEQHGIAPNVMRARIDTLLASLSIEHLRLRRLANLSGGERQRVAIAAVLA